MAKYLQKEVLFYIFRRFAISFIGLLLSGVLKAQDNTSYGTGALSQSQVVKYPISHIEITNPGSYSRPTVNLNVSGSVEWIYQYMEVSHYGFWFDAEFRSATDLGSFMPTISGGHGSGAALDVYSWEDNGYYHYVVYTISEGFGYVPQVALTPVTSPNSYEVEVYITGSNQLSLNYYDYNNLNVYTTAQTVSISFGGATAVAVLSTVGANGGNTAIGYQSQLVSTASKNTSLGAYSLKSNTSGQDNLALGFESLFSNTTGSRNLVSGYKAMYFNTTGYDNTAYGNQSMYSNTTGYNNLALGRYSLYKNQTGRTNIAIGTSSLYNNTGGYDNVGIGNNALYYNTTGYYNTGIGTSALNNNTSGRYNTAVGYQSLLNNTTSEANTAFGVQALMFNTTGKWNTAMGLGALIRNTTGERNVGIGYSALSQNNLGYNNAALGVMAGIHITAGYENTAIGHGAGWGLITGNQNTLIGAYATLPDPATSNTVVITDGSGSQRFYSPASGNVIMGRGNHPIDEGYKLDVGGTGRFADGLTLAAEPAISTVGYDVLTRNSSTGAIEKMNVELANMVNTTENQQISGNKFFMGAIGIGTAAPHQQLDVSGGIGFANHNSQDKKLYSPADGLLEWMTHNAAGEHGFAVSHQGTKMVYLNTNGHSYINGGNLGLGVSDPTEKLSVNGNIKAKAVKVDPNAWPDYVFAQQYQLPTLQAIENFIKEKGHLPEIPSAGQVAKEGVELGELGASLLKKIEELTLYLIQKDKELVEANKRIDALSEEIQKINTNTKLSR